MSARTYHAVIDAAKVAHPIRDLIAAAIDVTRERHPDAHPDLLLLNPCHLAALGTAIDAGGQRWMCSYLPIIGAREVRVGPVD